MNQLIKYEAAIYALAECQSTDEVKQWADKAAAMQAYGRMANDKTLEVSAAEIRIRAERRLGELLSQQKAEGGLSRGAAGVGLNQHTPNEVRSSVTRAPKLADAGISYDLSSRAQKLAAVPEAEFEAEVAGWKDRVQAEGARVSARLQKAGQRAMAKPEPEPEPDLGVDPIAELEIAYQRINELEEIVESLSQSEMGAECAKQIKMRQQFEALLNQRTDQLKNASDDRERMGKILKSLMQHLEVDSYRAILPKIREMGEAF